MGRMRWFLVRQYSRLSEHNRCGSVGFSVTKINDSVFLAGFQAKRKTFGINVAFACRTTKGMVRVKSGQNKLFVFTEFVSMELVLIGGCVLHDI